MAETRIRAVKSTKPKAPRPKASSTPTVTTPPPSSQKPDRSTKAQAETKDENAYCVPWYLP